MAQVISSFPNPASASLTETEASQNIMSDEELEELMSSMLMRGYVLCSSGCPAPCYTPLLKKESEHPSADQASNSSKLTIKSKLPILISSESFEHPFVPVVGVPYCVKCQAHVVTCEADIEALERSESFRGKGTILVAMKETEDDETRQDPEDFPLSAGEQEYVNSIVLAGDERSDDDGASSFTKSIHSILKESEYILQRPVVDPNRFTTTLFCGTTTSRQLVTASPITHPTLDPINMDTENGLGMNSSNLYNRNNSAGGASYDDTAFADALEEDVDDEEPQVGKKSPVEHIDTSSENEDNNEENEDPEDMMVEHSIRRDIAARAMGAKLLSGYTIRDTQCNICGMPYMELKGQVECVVCPLLKSPKSADVPAPKPLSPLHRKVQAIEKRWADEAQVVAEEVERRLKERQAVLEAELKAKRELEQKLFEERQAALEAELQARREMEAREAALRAAEEEERQRLAAIEEEERKRMAALEAERQEVLELRALQIELDKEGARRMRELESLLRQQAQEESLEADRRRLLEAAKRTNLPTSPVNANTDSPRDLSLPKYSFPSFSNDREFSAPSSPRVQAIINEMEQESYLNEAKVFVEALQLHEFDDAANVPVEILSPGAASVLKKALMMEDAEIDETNNHHPSIDEDEAAMLFNDSYAEACAEDDNFGQDAMSTISEQDTMNEKEVAVGTQLINDGETIWDQERKSLFDTKLIGNNNNIHEEELQYGNNELLEARLYADQMLFEEAKAAEEARALEEAVLAENARKEYEALLAEEARREEEERKAEQEWVLAETRRLELIEEKRLIDMASKNEKTFSEGDSLRHLAAMEEKYQRQILLSEEEAKRLEGIELTEKAWRLQIKQAAMDETEILLAALEKNAEDKQRAAEEAIFQAQLAKNEVSERRRLSLAQSIAQAEAEVMQETEEILEADLIKSTNHNVAIEAEMCLWEILLSEGRATLTRRMMQGWKLNNDLCMGEHCKGSPLVELNNKVECVVCGGSGSGLDGAYASRTTDDNQEIEETELEYADPHGVDDIESYKAKDSSAIESKSLMVEDPESFERKRIFVSQEIGKRMIEGWTLLDLSCPNCVMPLMCDGQGGPETCVVCGPISMLDSSPDKELEHVSQEETSPEIQVDVMPEIQAKNLISLIVQPSNLFSEGTTKMDPPESVKSSPPDDNLRDDPPAFFGDNYVSPKEAIDPPTDSVAGRFSFDLPEGIEIDDDLISVAKASNEMETHEIIIGVNHTSPSIPEGVDVDDDLISVMKATTENATKDEVFKGIDPLTTGIPDGINIDDDFISVMQATTEDATKFDVFKCIDPLTTRIPDGINIDDDLISVVLATNEHRIRELDNDISNVKDLAIKIQHTLEIPKETAVYDTRETKGSRKSLPPRPSPSSQKSPKNTDNARFNRAHLQSPSKEAQRRGPPRPEEVNEPSQSTNAKSQSSMQNRISPSYSMTSDLSTIQHTAGTPKYSSRGKSLSASLAELRSRDDSSIISDGHRSRAETVTSEALDAILDRIQACKVTLTQSRDFEKQKEMAALIEQLASAAVAVKKLEEMEIS